MWRVLILILLAGPALAEGGILDAKYAEPTTRYGHDALGPGFEWGAIDIRTAELNLRLVLPQDLVFEDTAPRLVDLDRDGQNEVLVVESHLEQGARLALWGPNGRIAAGPFIGQSFRWLAVIGAADFNGDGLTEIAYIETPHLGKVLKVMRREGDRLVEIASLGGLTNHHFGSSVIESAILECGSSATILTADDGWANVMATRMEGKRLVTRRVGPYEGPESFQNLPDCN